MKIIIIFLSFILNLMTWTLVYIGVHDELNYDIEKNKLWHSDGSFEFTMILVLLSVLSCLYAINLLRKK